MKKIITLSSFSLGIVFLTGCGRQPVSQVQPTVPASAAQASAQSISINKGVGLVYKNEKYGFEFTFDSGYKNLWGFYAENVANEHLLDSFHFTVADHPDPIFTLQVYDKNWWLKNAEIDTDKSAWRMGEKHSLHSTLGIYLGTSNKFAFTLNPNNQSCPDLGKEPAPLCELTHGKTEMVTNSFKITKK